MRFKHIAKPTLSPPSSGRATGSSSAGSTGVVVAEAMAGASERDKRLESPSTLHYCNQNTRPALAGLAGGRPPGTANEARPAPGATLRSRWKFRWRETSTAQAPGATLRSRWKFRWRETSTAQAPMEQMRSRLIGHGTRRGDAGRQPVSSSCTISKRDATRASPTARARPCSATLVVARVELVHDFETGRPRHAMPDVERDLVGATLVVARVAVVHAPGTGRDKPVPSHGT